MNVAVHVAQMNAVNTAMMAANNAARRNRNNSNGSDGCAEIGRGEFLACVGVVVVMTGIMMWLLWEVIK